jgi:hypothetical protein
MNEPVMPESPEVEEQKYASYHEVEAAKKITMQDIKDHMTGPVVSLIFHALAIVFLGSVIIFDPPEERKEIEVEMTNVDIKELEKPLEPPKTEEVEVEQEIIDRPDVVSDVQVEVEDAPMVDAPQDVVVPNVLAIAPSDSALVLPGVMSLRSGKGRKAAIKKYGGSGRTEGAVNKGLRWLRDHQNADGSWGETTTNKAFLTSVALLAFLGHNETPQSQEYGACVLKAIRRLIDMVNKRGGNGLVTEDQSAYGHAAVAYALSEACAITRIPMVETAMNSMIETLVKGQNTLGGYNYNHNNAATKADAQNPNVIGGVSRYDLSVSGWHYQGLKAAFAAGSTVQGLENAINLSIKGMKEVMYVSGGGFKYSNASKGGATPTMTSVGALCLQLMGEGKCRQVAEALKWIQESSGGKLLNCDWRGIEKNGVVKGWPLYLWYYETQAIFQYTNGTGRFWTEWNKEFQGALLKEQDSDGHWTSPVEKYIKGAGHGENKGTFKTQLDIDVYSTALCVLMFEVYYRYLPTFKVVVAAPATTEDAKTTDTTGLIIE